MTAAHLRLIVDCKTTLSARRVLSRLGKLISFHLHDLGPYDKGGFEAYATITISAVEHSAKVVEVLQVAQKFGRGWELTGHVSESIDLTCTEFSVAGVEFACLTVDVS